MNEVTAILLAGGKSSRMGQNKAFMTLDENKPVIVNIVEKLKEVTNNIIISTNTPEEYECLQLPMVQDYYTNSGPLAGIHAALTSSTTDKNLVVACDMPFISVNFARYILAELKDYFAAVPYIDNRWHPLFAAYHKKTISSLEQSILAGDFKISNYLQSVNTKKIDETKLKNDGFIYNEQFLYNMNNAADYKKALAFTRKGR